MRPTLAMLWRQKQKMAATKTRRTGRRRRSGRGGTGTTTVSARGDIGREADHKIESAATDTETAPGPATDDATMTGMIDTGTDREVASIGDETTAQSVAESTAPMTSGRSHVQEIDGTNVAQGADHRTRGPRGGGTEAFATHVFGGLVE
jgi:hypothetical protein